MKAQYLEVSNYNRLFPYMQYENALALRVSLETGLRIDDVLSLTKDNIIDGYIVTVAEKTDKKGKWKISAHLLQELMNRPGRGYIFPKRKGKCGHRTRQAVYVDMKRALARADIEKHASPHSARKTFAVEKLKKTGDIKVVQKELQHSDSATTAIYAYADHDAAGNCYGCFMAALPQIARAIARAIIEELSR